VPEPILNITSLDAFYGDFQALYNVDMHLHAGEVLAVIGANGAGKSTLLRTIAGLISSDDNQITYKESAIGSLRPDQIAMLGIALVPEGRQLFQSLSVKENLLIGCTTKRSGSWNLNTVYELFPVLKEKANTPSHDLSGGQQQMVAIGRALMANPDLIMFDEISLGLAPVIVKTIYEALPQVIAAGTSAIIVEQDINKALEIASRVYCLQEGRVALESKAADVSQQEISRAYFGLES